ncbi:MAG: hypothetical protein COW48_09755 [Hydrogenophilales bacterium CG17_big_fil_post_rev_8_21_14_2_50_63_12]|nr:MAG: hypothetical protein COX55_10250 [Zetaproteobacteria bacterium CG23_combo_of_CG06-09_8_20_14_all_54_7]PIV87738.1 MAG: hypothetical protein COW48_09755 [Hydrogenophilales bacterium CG17_big_fil_post_rev_8_21_14_2_50_63_12]
MKNTIALATLALLVSPAWAHDLDANPDLKQSILNVHVYVYPNKPGDSTAPAKGVGDAYGSVLLDKGSHTPHKPGDTHEPEKGTGDTYGSVLKDVPKK